MTDLHKKNCIPCRGGISPFDISEIHKYLTKVDGWDVKKKENEIYFLEKNFTFKNFSESQKFVNEIGDIAELQCLQRNSCPERFVDGQPSEHSSFGTA